MRLIIEPPTWLGDAVMASGAIEKLIESINPKEVIFLGSSFSLELLNAKKAIINKKDFSTYKKFPKCDVFISFRRSLFSKLLAFKAKKAFFFKKYNGHMVQKYSHYVNDILNNLGKKSDLKIYKPKLNYIPKNYTKPTAGINPGATYGSAKRWYPKEFAKVANYLSDNYDIIIFGGPGEENIAKDIENALTCKNYTNLCGKLTIKELCEHIGGLSVFITNDSGPMHIAAAFNIPTFAIFGPTDPKETHPYSQNYTIISKNLSCAPCKKRECPIKTHECMKDIKAEDVIKTLKERGI